MSRRVAIIGAGPAGMYAAERLVEAGCSVTFFEARPEPMGLLRFGVAPDHEAMRSLAKRFEPLLADERVTLRTGVRVGEDVAFADIRRDHDQVLLAVGAVKSRQLSVPGAQLPGCTTGGAVVAWYNGDPLATESFDLSAVRRVVIVGVGNVATDVARILSCDPASLCDTCMPPVVQAQLEHSAVEEVVILGRRGEEQASYTPKERQSVEERATRPVHFRFCTSVVEVLGATEVTGVRIERNELITDGFGSVNPRGTGETEVLDAELVVAAIGFDRVPIEGVPWFEAGSCFDVEADGRLLHDVWAVGWARYGPRGLLGDTKKDARFIAGQMLAARVP